MGRTFSLSLNPLTAVPLVLCDSRALLSLDFNTRMGGTMIFPSVVVVMNAVMNLLSGSIVTSQLSVSLLLAPGGHESASGGVFTFPGTYRIL